MNSKKEEIWDQIKSLLKNHYPPEEIELWFSHTSPLELRDNQLFIQVTNRFVSSWLRDNYLATISRLLESRLGSSIVINFVVQDQIPASGFCKPFEPSYRLDNFILDDNNIFAYNCVQKISSSPRPQFNPLFVYGNPGVGKTHLLCAAGNQFISNNISTGYLSGQFFVDESQSTTNERIMGWDALLVDDVHLLAGHEIGQHTFIKIFDHFYEQMKPIFVTSRVPSHEIQKLDEKLLSRFNWGLIIHVGPLKQDTTVNILRSQIAGVEHLVHEDVLFFLASTRRPINQLQMDLNRILKYLTIRPKKIDISTVKNLLQGFPKEPKISAIQQLVARYYNLDVAQLCSANKSRATTHARQVAMYLSRKLTALSLKEIARAFGRKDHSTVHYALRNIEKKVMSDSKLKKEMEWFMSNFL